MTDIHKQGLVACLSDIFASSKYSDLTIKCGTDQFKVHRAIVCGRSKFFAAACNGKFLVRLTIFYHIYSISVYESAFIQHNIQGAKTSTIELEDDDLEIVRRMLTYFYTLNYDDEGAYAFLASYAHRMIYQPSLVDLQLPEHEEFKLNKEMNNVAVYAIADKYDIPELKELAKAKLRVTLSSGQLDYLALKVVDAIFVTTPSTDAGMRQVAIDFCASHVRAITEDEGYNYIVKIHGDLGLGMLLNQSAKVDIKHKKEKRNNVATIKERLSSQIRVLNAASRVVSDPNGLLRDEAAIGLRRCCIEIESIVHIL